MKWTIAQIGTNRLKRVLVANKDNNPQIIIDALKYDLKQLLDSYMENFNINICVNQEDNVFNFSIDVTAERIKSFGTLASN